MRTKAARGLFSELEDAMVRTTRAAAGSTKPRLSTARQPYDAASVVLMNMRQWTLGIPPYVTFSLLLLRDSTLKHTSRSISNGAILYHERNIGACVEMRIADESYLTMHNIGHPARPPRHLKLMASAGVQRWG